MGWGRSFVGVALAGFALLALVAPAPAPAANLARIAAPQPDALVRGPALTVVVRVGSPAPSFRAWLGTREITNRFRRRGRALVARIPRGPSLRPGTRHVYVQTRSGRRTDFDAVSFVVGRRARGLLTLVGPRARRQAGALTARVRLRRVRDRLLVRLNGRRVDALFRSRFAASRAARLGADDGLRFGRNRLSVVTFRPDGRYDAAARAILVPRTRPLAGAGPDRRTHTGLRVRLDGRSSRAATRGARLAFRWRIVRRPRGSRARLRGATTATPSLLPDRRGVYRVGVTVTERRGAAASGVTAQASDVATVTVVDDHPPIGLPVQTIADENGGGIRVGGTLYPNPGPKSIQLLVLDRATLEVDQTASTNFDGNGDGVAQLSQALGNLDASSLAIVNAGPYGGIDYPFQDRDGFNAAVQRIGAAMFTFNQERWFSVIGVPGLGQGYAFQTAGLSGTAGALTGYLQRDVHGNYTFVSPEYVSFDTNLPGNGNRVVMRVGASTYSSDPIPSGTAAFFAVQLDERTLAPKGQWTFHVNGAGQDANEQSRMLQTLTDSGLYGDPVFIASQGLPKPTTALWGDIGFVIDQMSGSGHVFNTLDGGRDYGAVLGRDFDRFAPEDSQHGRVTGVLARRRDYGFQPLLGGAQNPTCTSTPDGDCFNAELLQVAYQPPQAWPSFDAAAMKYIAGQLELSGDDVRPSYWGNRNVSWDDKAGDLRALAYPGTGHGFTQQDFDALKQELLQEFEWVVNVQTYVKNLASPFDDNLPEYADFQQIAQQVESAVSPPADEDADGRPLEIVSEVLDLLAVATSPIDPVALPVEGVAAGFALAGTLANAPDGTPQLLGEIQTSAANLAAALADSYTVGQESLESVADILVSDHGKLKLVGTKTTGDAAWAWSTPIHDAAVDMLELGAKRWAYSHLMPVAYTAYNLTPPDDNARNWGFFYRLPPFDYNCAYDFKDEPDSGQYVYVTGFNNDMSRQTQLWALGKPSYVGGAGAGPPPASLTDPLFTPVDRNGLGLGPWYFFARNFTPVTLQSQPQCT